MKAAVLGILLSLLFAAAQTPKPFAGFRGVHWFTSINQFSGVTVITRDGPTAEYQRKNENLSFHGFKADRIVYETHSNLLEGVYLEFSPFTESGYVKLRDFLRTVYGKEQEFSETSSYWSGSYGSVKLEQHNSSKDIWIYELQIYDASRFVKRVQLAQAFADKIQAQWAVLLKKNSPQNSLPKMKQWITANKPANMKDYYLSSDYQLSLQYYDAAPMILRLNVPGSSALQFKEGVKKPVIYLYPESPEKVTVQLDFDGEITHTYPNYPATGWRVTAFPDGRLVDSAGKEYYSLFWEGTSSQPMDTSSGFTVDSDSVEQFLEEKLSLLGLNYREKQEFIIFWAPILKRNSCSLIHFEEESYRKRARLTVMPKPDTEIRIMMQFKSVPKGYRIPMQKLVPVTRSGFTLVEWGGTNYDENSGAVR